MNTTTPETRTVRVVCANPRSAELLETALRMMSKGSDGGYSGLTAGILREAESISRYVPTEDSPVRPCDGCSCYSVTVGNWDGSRTIYEGDDVGEALAHVRAQEEFLTAVRFARVRAQSVAALDREFKEAS